jgi:hypothetical protein
MFYPTVVQWKKGYERQEGKAAVRKNANVLRIPRKTVEAPQVPHVHGVEKLLGQKRAEKMTLMSVELLTPVVSMAETRSGAQILVDELRIYLFNNVGTKCPN